MTGLRRALLLVAVEGLVVGLVALRARRVVRPRRRPLRAGPDHRLHRLVVHRRRPLRLVAAAGEPLRRADERGGLRLVPPGADRGGLELAVHDRRARLEPLRRRLRAHDPRLPVRPAGGRAAAGRHGRAATRISILGPAPILLFSDRIDADCEGCPSSAILIEDDETLEIVFNTITSVLAVVLVGYVLYVLLARWQRATLPQRRALAPVLWSGVVLLTLLAASLTSEAVGGPDAVDGVAYALAQLAFAITPYAFLYGLVRSRVIRGGAVTELLQRMGDTRTGGGLRALLASALGDRSLRVLYWLDDKEAWVDALGRPATLPDDGDPARSWTSVDHEGRRVGAIVHDRVLCDDPELVASVATAAGLAIENERLEAQLRARVEELRVVARPDRRGRHRRAPAAGAQPARRRPAAARRALALDARRPEQAAHRPRHGRGAAGGRAGGAPARARGAARARPRHPPRDPLRPRAPRGARGAGRPLPGPGRARRHARGAAPARRRGRRLLRRSPRR